MRATVMLGPKILTDHFGQKYRFYIAGNSAIAAKAKAMSFSDVESVVRFIKRLNVCDNYWQAFSYELIGVKHNDYIVQVALAVISRKVKIFELKNVVQEAQPGGNTIIRDDNGTLFQVVTISQALDGGQYTIREFLTKKDAEKFIANTVSQKSHLKAIAKGINIAKRDGAQKENFAEDISEAIIQGDAVVVEKIVTSGTQPAEIQDSVEGLPGTKEAGLGPEEEEKPKLVSIDIINSEADDVFLTSKADQYINLPTHKKWEYGGAKIKKDRISGSLRFKVVFNQAGSHKFSVQLIAGAKNIQYTATEKSDNSKFDIKVGVDSQKFFQTDADGTKIIEGEFKASPAGNDEFSLQAEDDDCNVAKSSAVVCKRLIYLVSIKMKTLSSVATSTSILESEFKKHGILFENLESVEMDHMPNISRPDKDPTALETNSSFQAKAVAEYNSSKGPAHSPACVAVAYTDHLGVMRADDVFTKAAVKVGAGESNVIIPTVTASGDKRFIWQNLDSRDWFVSATFLKDGGDPSTDTVDIDKVDCETIDLSRRPGASQKVKIDVGCLPAGEGTITLKINTLNYFRGGMSFGGNLICVCTRSYWKNISTSKQNQIIVHEMGHKIGMVPTGSDKSLPEKPIKQYTGKGHSGSHCHEGVGVLASYSGVSGSTCVMFGATNGISAFCGNCEEIVKKIDLSKGW